MKFLYYWCFITSCWKTWSEVEVSAFCQQYSLLIVKINKIQQSMYNIYKNEKKSSDKSELRILDYRNGKYQGTTVGSQMTRDGVGMVLDHNYLLAIAAWKEGYVDGEVIIIFPDCTIFYGFLKNKLPVGIGSYQVSGKLQIYSHIGNANEDLFVLDDNTNKTLILLAISKQIMEKLYEEPTVYEHVLREQNTIKEMAKITFKKEVGYANANQKWEIIENFFKTVYMSELKSYKEFIKHYFQTQVKVDQAKVEIVQTKQQVQFNYQNSSIHCKIGEHHESDSDFRVKLLGYYNHHEHQFQVAKKMALKNDMVQQTIENFRSQYSFKNRPAVCIKHIQSYYRKSLQFVNDFLEIDYLYRIKFIYHSIEASIGQLSINRNAQRLLQKPNLAEVRREEREGRTRESKLLYPEAYSKEHLDKVKDQIYKAARNKSNSHVKSTSNSKLQYRPPDSSYSKVTNMPQKQREDIEHSRSNANFNASPGKRSFVYLQQHDRVRTFKNSPNRYEYTKAVNRRAESKSNGKLTKYKYLDESVSAKKIENLTALTNYYEEIENELRKETPKMSQRKHRNFDGVIGNRYVLYEKKEEKADPLVQKEEKSPLGAKKVFKYGWE